MVPFRVRVMSLRRVLYDGETTSVYLSGDEGEFELLAFHYSLMGALPEGDIKIAGHEDIHIRTGCVMFGENQCTIIVEESEQKADFSPEGSEG
jgi:F0F1-type ATP synthase epsilon subunit